MRFTGSSLVALGVSSIAFVVLCNVFVVPMLVASGVGAIVGCGVNFAISRVLTFKRKGEVPVRSPIEVMPSLNQVRDAMFGMTLAVFLPAYEEEANLPGVVEKLHFYLSSLRLPDFRIIIVDDGSLDNTQWVAQELQSRFEEVLVVTHEVNRGYGAALISGFLAAVETGMDYWGFADADGQFAPESLGTLLVACAATDADLAVGQRIGRKEADSKFRFLLGRAWHLFGQTVVGRQLLTIADVDCGLKVGRTKALAVFVEKLRGQAAAISPELIARTNLSGQSIVEAGVTHLPREAGESTGGKPRVMLKSAWSLVRLGTRLRVERVFANLNSDKGGFDVDAYAAARTGE